MKRKIYRIRKMSTYKLTTANISRFNMDRGVAFFFFLSCTPVHGGRKARSLVTQLSTKPESGQLSMVSNSVQFRRMKRVSLLCMLTCTLLVV